MTIAFWDASGALVCERIYTTMAEKIIGYLDMIEAVTAGGYCLVEIENRAQLVTGIGQLLR